MSARAITKDELAQHNKSGDAWLAIHGDVYDISKFAAMHPGGEMIILEHAGTDASDIFWSYHSFEVLQKQERLIVGRLEGSGDREENRILGASDISTVPYAEPSFWMGWKSTYYTDAHKKFRAQVRKFLDQFRDEAERGEATGAPPSEEVFHAMGEEGFLAARIGPGEHLKLVPRLPGGVKPEEFDYFHEGIVHEEIARLATPGFIDGMGAGMVIGLPPVLQFGPDWMKKTVAAEVLQGKKRICLAISEPAAGSDVANMLTRAEESPDGEHYIVNGAKKWITGGHAADYFVTAVRTGGKGAGGVSMMLIERSEGLETKSIQTSYSKSAGTAYVTFENVKVPKKNVIGFENGGFLCIMYNFNHERWFIIAYTIAATRGVIEQCMKWAYQRRAFGKRLIEQPVVRHKLARCIAELESVQAWYENLTYQMTQLPYDEQSMKLGSAISLLKFQATRVAHRVSDECVQIFGGRGITQTGMGRLAERFQRTYKFAAILGGSEEIMADLGVNLAMKTFPKNARL
mmetsp:Transcript_41271/g.90025  ORF Transcript_41271/g.90025 Transcript_41271/m.90025 type:complete len:517 (+) Transcript_41271:60-1610(+)